MHLPLFVPGGVWIGWLKAGQHRVEIGAEGFLAASRDVKMERGGREMVTVTLERDPNSALWKKPSRWAAVANTNGRVTCRPAPVGQLRDTAETPERSDISHFCKLRQAGQASADDTGGRKPRAPGPRLRSRPRQGRRVQHHPDALPGRVLIDRSFGVGRPRPGGAAGPLP